MYISDGDMSLTPRQCFALPRFVYAINMYVVTNNYKQFQADESETKISKIAVKNSIKHATKNKIQKLLSVFICPGFGPKLGAKLGPSWHQNLKIIPASTPNID